MKIVFFGDSVTEGGRDLNNPADLGTGFVKIAASKLRPLYPEAELEILNRGVGGDRTAELLLRVEKDVLAEKPDFVVLDVGINDVCCRARGVEVTPEEFRKNYEALVEKILSSGARLILMQPFLLRVSDKLRFRPHLNTASDIIREIAKREKLTLIPVDEIFNGVTQDIAPVQFAADGVHPTHRGCRYLADLVIKELKKYLN